MNTAKKDITTTTASKFQLLTTARLKAEIFLTGQANGSRLIRLLLTEPWTRLLKKRQNPEK